MPFPAILVIEPDPAVVRTIEENLRDVAAVRAATTLQKGLEQLREQRWSALLVSLSLPAGDLGLVERLLEDAHTGVEADLATLEAPRVEET